MRIPIDGIVGKVALREATSELRDLMKLVRQALHGAINKPGLAETWIEISAIYPDRVIVQNQSRYYAYPYSIDNNNVVSVDEINKVEVTREFAPVAMREAMAGDVRGAFVEAVDDKGSRWRIRVMRSGLSENRNFYPDIVLREAAPLFDGARVLVKADKEHLTGRGKNFNNWIGRLSNAQFIEGKKKDSGELHADFDVLESAGDVAAKLREAWDRSMADQFGFSIDADGRAKRQSGRQVATQITKVKSVDLILDASAGGELVKLLEAFNPEVDADMKLKERMISVIKKANNDALPDGLDVDDDELLEVAYREAIEAQHNPSKEARPASATGESASAATEHDANLIEAVDERIRMVETRANMRVTIADSKLPEAAKLKLRKQFDVATTFTEAQVEQAIADEREYLAHFSKSGKPDTGDTSFIEAGEDRADKVAGMLDSFFDKSDRSVRSFRECYVDITGDQQVSGDWKKCDVTRLREAVSEVNFREAISAATFGDILGDSITRAMIKDYNIMSKYDVWRRLADVVPLNDFRQQERTRMGGYGDLPAVAENGSYDPLTSPSDDAANYTASKRGGTETVSLETIKNDDVGAIQRLPTKLSRAAKRTLAKFVLDFLATNPTIYDTTALFTAGHGNLGTTALDPTTLAARRLAMLQQAELDSADPLGVEPVDLWVPADLEEAAFDLFRRATNNDTDFIESLQMNVIPVWYWTDANNWFVTADKDEVPLIEVGFMDGNEEPEIFIQDNPTQGSLFTNDQIKYKIRHIYGGNVLDYRGFQGSIVP